MSSDFALRRLPSFLSLISFLVQFLLCSVNGLASTDTITWGGDNSRAGYQNNHNMDPSVVGSAQFGQIFRTALPGNFNGAAEQIFSQPLVYTGSDGVQYVYIATTQNNIYKLDAKTGVIVLSKNLAIPFLTSDLDGCVDINPLVGITGTGVIDPSTDTWYLDTKTYVDQNPSGAKGKPNGRHYFHAINVNDFSERPNFPVGLEGITARNNPSRMFNGGIHHQRPAMLHYGQYIYVGYGSHCVQYNFTGWIVGYDKTTGAIVEKYATEGAGVDNTVPGAGVWMSGGGLASDDRGSMFFATGNGYASQLNGVPVNGRTPPTSLEEAAVHMSIADDGTLTPVDFFMPYEKVQLDGADKDLGTSPLEILPSQFSCGNVKRIGVVTGKSGKTYWIDLDNMGGYQNGPNKGDAVIEVFQNENSVYAGAGVYPLEGGYIYINVIQYASHVFKFSCTNGVPYFTKVADSPEKNAYVLGVGHGTVTSLNDQPGTGLVWTSDVEGTNLRVYNAVPVNGLLTRINAWNVVGITKFTRPVFGDGRVYIGTTQGYIYGFGSPVNLPLNCTSPNDFGSSNLNVATSPRTITCTANINTQITSLALSGNPNFNITQTPTLPINLGSGSSFTFQAIFNPTQVGPLSSDVLVNTTNSVDGYSITTPVNLRGTGQSVAPLLAVSPNTVSFTGVITGQTNGGVNQSVIILNQGNANLSISNIQYSLQSETGPYVAPNMTSSGPQAGPFTFIGLPATIPGNSQVTVIINFNPSTSGNFAAYLKINSNGGSKLLDVVGTSGTYPVALVEFQTTDGSGWVKYQEGVPFTFGNVTQGVSRYLQMRLTNNGTADAGRLSVTVSKPPFGVPGIIGANNQIDLAEGTTLAPGENATATLYCSVPKSQINLDPYYGSAHWTLNVDDPNFTKNMIQFACTAVTQQGPPLLANGSSIMKYIGCFQDNNPDRQLPTQVYSSPNNNTNEMCVKACSDAGFVFAATEYNEECWCGNKLPSVQVPEGNCNYACTGDVTEVCGGNGLSSTPGSYMSLFADRTKYDGTNPSPLGPFVNPGVNGYVSQGCYTEINGGRALPYAPTFDTPTIANCIAACAGYQYAGAEYGQECYCGNAIGQGSVPAPDSDCNMPCKSNATEYCGAGGRLNVYMLGGTLSSSTSSASSTSTTGTSTSGTATISTTSTTSTSPTASPTGPAVRPRVGAYSFMGCYKEASNTRALTYQYINDPMTLESCAAFASQNGYPYWGVEYARECWAGPAIMGDSAVTATSECGMLCPGDSSTYCGDGNRLQMYQLNSTTTSSSSSTSSSTSTSATSSTISTSTTATTSSSSSTTSSTSSTTSSISTSTSSTSSTASISSTTTSSSTSASATPTGPSIVQSVGSFKYVGCYTEPNTGRALSSVYANNSMTVEMCAAQCASNKYIGLEYATECWCGDTLDPGANLTTSGCTMTCGGNNLQMCGGPVRLQMYMKAAVTSTTSSTSTSLSSTSSSTSTSSTSTSTSSSRTSTSSSSSTATTSSSSSTSTSSTTSRSTTTSLSTTTTSSSTSTSTSSTSSRSTTTSSTSSSTSSTLSSTSTSSTTSRSTTTTSVSSTSSSSSSTSRSSTTTSTSTTSTSSTSTTTSRTSSSTTSSSSSTTSRPSTTTTSTTTSSSTTSRPTTTTSSSTTSRSTTTTTSSSSSSTTTRPSTTSTSTSTTSSRSSTSSTSTSSSAVPTYTGPPIISTGNSNFSYFGCIGEPSNGRALPNLVAQSDTAMTVATCLKACWNYKYAGIEYARECWCGNTLAAGYTNLTSGAAGSTTPGACDQTCTGNGTEYCGAGVKLNLYQFNSTKAAGK